MAVAGRSYPILKRVSELKLLSLTAEVRRRQDPGGRELKEQEDEALIRVLAGNLV